MNKQTAVEWLIKKLTNRQNGFFDGFPHLSIDKIYEQAKKMEKQQIVDAYIEGDCTGIEAIGEYKSLVIKDAEQYYNETYNNEK
jgi:hypothetical protein